MNCPICDVSLSMTDRQGIEIDFCPQCRGVWLDRGELDKIIERSTAEIAPAQPASGSRGYDGGHREHGGKHGGGYSKHGSRRKSWLHDLFD